jgi:DNA modification methylase
MATWHHVRATPGATATNRAESRASALYQERASNMRAPTNPGRISFRHPTPKPVPLLEELIRASAPSQGLILDPFAGSGPTLIAAERTGRACYAAEPEPRYCGIVLARWEALSGCKATCSTG